VAMPFLAVNIAVQQSPPSSRRWKACTRHLL